jgi:hypothetical protein
VVALAFRSIKSSPEEEEEILDQVHIVKNYNLDIEWLHELSHQPY